MLGNPQSSHGKGPAIAIDGPVASGKSSVGRAVAQRLHLRFLDTGIMYRAVTWLALRRGILVTDVSAVERLAMDCSMTVAYGGPESAAIIIDGHPLRQELTTAEVDRSVSAVAAAPGVRRALVQRQQAIGAGGSIVMVGRDIGSVVLPDADAKLYIDASPEERARRRWQQQQLDTGPTADYGEVLADTIRRDNLDSQRSDSPLTVADGALVINTDGMDFAQTVCAVVAAVCRVTGRPLKPAAEQ